MQFLAEQHLVAAKLVRKNGAASVGAERELFIRKSNSRRQREHDMEVRHRQQIGFARASQSFAAAPWHFGQCRLRQELYEI
jgi:hypothetical protein